MKKLLKSTILKISIQVIEIFIQELKIGINQVKGLIIANSSKQIIKNIKDLNKKPNKVIDKRSDNLPFQLLHSGGCLDLVAPNFNELEDFQNAIDELVKQKKSIYAYLKFQIII